MCGIFALFNNRNYANVPKNIVKDCFMRGHKRGPETSTYNDDYNSLNNIILGFHRLAIVGLNESSDQPITVNNITVICNGEIYNYNYLKDVMKINTKTNSDCEIIIHLYEKYGIETALTMLDGVFAFVLHDNRYSEKVTYIARDPYGIRALYQLVPKTITGQTMPITAVASEMKSLIGLVKNDIVGENGTSDYSIKQFPPASYLKMTLTGGFLWDYTNNDSLPVKYNNPVSINTASFYTGNGESSTGGYYSSSGYSHSTGQLNQKFNQIVKTIGESLKTAVSKRVTTTERPIACLLSGGLDSSIIASLVTKCYDKQLETYSIGLEGSEDLKYARCVADFLNTKHTEIIVTEDTMFSAIPEVIRAIESYDTTTVRASVGNYLVAKYIKENSDAKVIFNGDGADELMGGYLYFNKAPDLFEFNKECKRLLDDIHYFDVLRSDKSIASNGLEARTPFLDKQFVQDYLNIPLNLRFKQVDMKTSHEIKQSANISENDDIPEKYILRLVALNNNLLPLNVIWRRKEAFSDGVSGAQKSWYEIINDKLIENNITDQIPDVKYLNNEPVTLEQKYYRMIFEKYYPNMGNSIPYFWMPKYVNATDSSARTLSIY